MCAFVCVFVSCVSVCRCVCECVVCVWRVVCDCVRCVFQRDCVYVCVCRTAMQFNSTGTGRRCRNSFRVVYRLTFMEMDTCQP